jgi:ribosomal protein L11 methyltransferase
MASWKVTLPCTRAEAERIEFDGNALALLDPPPALMTSERVDDDPNGWQLEAYFEGKPNSAAIAAVQALVPSAAGVRARAERIRDSDWVTLSQSGFPPVQAGRFYVHTAGNKGRVPEGTHPIRIEASRAFGTGHHETTSGCLVLLDELKRQGLVVRNLLDLGTGTGLLAFAALHLWPRAEATASDIDPAAVDVTAENARMNGVPVGEGPGAVTLVAAPGLDHRVLIRRAPYDLIIANILAGPLVELAPSVAAALAEGGTLVLAGVLERQAGDVARAYRRHGLVLQERHDSGEWPALRFRKRVRYGADRVRRGSGGRGEAPGFGSW